MKRSILWVQVLLAGGWLTFSACRGCGCWSAEVIEGDGAKTAETPPGAQTGGASENPSGQSGGALAAGEGERADAAAPEGKLPGAGSTKTMIELAPAAPVSEEDLADPRLNANLAPGAKRALKSLERFMEANPDFGRVRERPGDAERRLREMEIGGPR